MMGYNGTVFAYGQTASGKTYVSIYDMKSEPILIHFCCCLDNGKYTSVILHSLHVTKVSLVFKMLFPI